MLLLLMRFVLFFLLTCCAVYAEPLIKDKVLICGVARNVGKAIPNDILSATELGECFADYRVIIYENNSTDKTKKLFRKWAKKNPKFVFLSEQLSSRKLVKRLAMQRTNRTELIAMARNQVMKQVSDKKYDDFKYVIWVDMDFLQKWDIPNIVNTILHPEQDWDAVFAYGGYDLFALRTPEWPIGFELLGHSYWEQLNEIRKEFVMKRDDPWKPVYSAFGGLGIYKREAIKGCWYSGVVTRDLEKVEARWLETAKKNRKGIFLEDYENLVAATTPILLKKGIIDNRDQYPDTLGVQMNEGGLVWFSCTNNSTLPWTCEHLPLHATMTLRGYHRFFINPKIHVEQ
jgi:hypothetical protein